MNFELFLMCLLVSSALTGLTTEAIKTLMTEHNKTYHANTLAGIVAIVESFVLGIGGTILTDSAFTSDTIVFIVALVFMSWLCAMVGYDKVVQTISQFKKDV